MGEGGARGAHETGVVAQARGVVAKARGVVAKALARPPVFYTHPLPASGDFDHLFDDVLAYTDDKIFVVLILIFGSHLGNRIFGNATNTPVLVLHRAV